MKRASRRLTVLASMAAAVMLSLVLSPTPASAADSTLAWSCPSGNVCVWDDENGEGDRCNWDVADPDWYNGNIVCSWADDRQVQSAYNNGTSSAYGSVRFYEKANYSDSGGCLSQGGGYDSSSYIKLRSHRWVSSGC